MRLVGALREHSEGLTACGLCGDIATRVFRGEGRSHARCDRCGALGSRLAGDLPYARAWRRAAELIQ